MVKEGMSMIDELRRDLRLTAEMIDGRMVVQAAIIGFFAWALIAGIIGFFG